MVVNSVKYWSAYKQLYLNQLRQMHYRQRFLIQKVRVFFADVKGMIIINFGFIYTSKLCYRNVFFLLRSELIFYSSSLPFFHLLPFPVSLFFYYFYCGFLSCIAVINEQWISQKPQNFFKPQKHEIKNVNLPSEMMNANE